MLTWHPKNALYSPYVYQSFQDLSGFPSPIPPCSFSCACSVEGGFRAEAAPAPSVTAPRSAVPFLDFFFVWFSRLFPALPSSPRQSSSVIRSLACNLCYRPETVEAKLPGQCKPRLYCGQRNSTKCGRSTLSFPQGLYSKYS